MSVNSKLISCLGVLLIAATPAATAEDIAEILLTRQLMEARGLRPGDTILLSTDPTGRDPRPFKIVSGYEPTPDPFRLAVKRYEARLHLPDLIDLVAASDDPLAGESVDRINISLVDPADAAAFAHDLAARVPGLIAVPTTETAGADLFVVLERFHLAIALVTVLGSTAFLLALMVMRADQRRETSGVLRLIGFSRPRILSEVFVEGLCIAVAGAGFGIAVAIALQGVFNVFFQWYYDTALIFIKVTPGIALRCLALAVPLGVLAGLVASWTLLRRDILALLRR